MAFMDCAWAQLSAPTLGYTDIDGVWDPLGGTPGSVAAIGQSSFS
jgi:hypothetical protein